MPGRLTDREQRKLTEAFEQAALSAGYKMKVRSEFGSELKFSDFATDLATGAAINYVLEKAATQLRIRGIKLSFGSGGGGGLWDDIKPDRYAIIVDGKKVYGGMSWDF